MTVSTFENALHSHLVVPKTKRNQRNGQCACLLGVDIGAYDTCGHLCKYCYANANAELVRRNMQKHNPNSPFLLGNNMPGDVVHEAKQKSWLDGQLCLNLEI
jgi:DNA repair photolyase